MDTTPEAIRTYRFKLGTTSPQTDATLTLYDTHKTSEGRTVLDWTIDPGDGSTPLEFHGLCVGASTTIDSDAAVRSALTFAAVAYGPYEDQTEPNEYREALKLAAIELDERRPRIERFALALMDWHGGQGSALYALGSTLYAWTQTNPITDRESFREFASLTDEHWTEAIAELRSVHVHTYSTPNPQAQDSQLAELAQLATDAGYWRTELSTPDAQRIQTDQAAWWRSDGYNGA